jgi:PilZ domain
MERRASQRYGLQLAISFRRVSGFKENLPGEKEVLGGETSNISTGGIYFTTAHALTLNEVLDFSLAFPGLAREGDALVTGRARVVRVVQIPPISSETAGVAVVTEEYHILEPGAAA